MTGKAQRGPIEVIPNALSALFSTGAPGPVRRQFVVGLGRFTREKGFDLLIEAWGQLALRFPDWELVLAGGGPLESELRAMAGKQRGRVRFIGPVEQPQQLLREAAVFALASRYEGFPNALIEAMACGCAVVATDCPFGPAEIIHHGLDGLLVAPEASPALADGLAALMGDASLRLRLGGAAIDVQRRFGLESVVSRWQALFERLVA